MTIQRTYQLFRSKQRLNFIITAGITLFIFVNVLLDFSITLYQESSFYLSESLLFSSYWLIFLPLVTFVSRLNRETERFGSRLFLIGSAVAFHLFSYPALVWLISRLFFQHTFDYWQTFNFGLSSYLIKTIIIYVFSFIALTFWKKPGLASGLSETVEEIDKQSFISSVLVSDSNNQRLLLQVNDISYFSADSPYISIYHLSKKYLHTETLKSLEDKLDDQQFVRIHKSHIVNIKKISAIQSRQNGDHDLTLLDGTTLRISRNYARNFKSIFFKHHQHALK